MFFWCTLFELVNKYIDRNSNDTTNIGKINSSVWIYPDGLIKENKG